MPAAEIAWIVFALQDPTSSQHGEQLARIHSHVELGPTAAPTAAISGTHTQREETHAAGLIDLLG